MTTQEGSHTLSDGRKLYTKTFKAQGQVRARLIFIHGFSEHINTYDNLFPPLARRGIEIYAFDQRGWGRSVKQRSERGDTGPTTLVLDDMTSFIKASIPSSVPLFLMGHSMGGGQVLCYAAQGPMEVRKHIRGYLLESPFIDFNKKSKPSSIQVFAGRLAGKILPHKQLVNKLDSTLLSRDPEIGNKFDADSLCHNTGTLEGLSGLLDRTEQMASGKITVPHDAGEGGVARIWIGHGDKDGITDYNASKRLADALQVKDKEFKTYPGHYHRLHDEPSPDKEAFVDDVANWILTRSNEPVQAEDSRPRL